MTDPELKPCPACGATDVFVGEQGPVFFAACIYCNMKGPETLRQKGAIDEWNALPRRADIERVERERDWLASERAASKSCPTCPSERPRGVNCATVRPDEKTPCKRCWLEAARQAITER